MRIISFKSVGAFVALALTAVSTQAQIVTLAHNNSLARVDTGSSAGMFNWSVDGQNQLAQQWFWFRVGPAGPEAPINTISAPSITTPNARTLYSRYNNGAFGVEIDYTLTGFSPGSGFSDIAETITITNATAAPLDFHFFQYSDFDIGGAGGDTVSIGTNSNPASPFFGRPNSATVTDPFAGMTETVITPAANRAEAGLFNATLVKLNNGVADSLNNNLGPVGPGDATWALQWNLIIDPMSSVGISKDKFMAIQLAPEPATGSLLLLGLGAFAIRRRK